MYVSLQRNVLRANIHSTICLPSLISLLCNINSVFDIGYACSFARREYGTMQYPIGYLMCILPVSCLLFIPVSDIRACLQRLLPLLIGYVLI